MYQWTAVCSPLLLCNPDLSYAVMQVAPQLAAGPSKGLEPFLDALQQLEASNALLQSHAGLLAAKGAIEHSQVTFNDALGAAAGDFRSALAAAGQESPLTPAWLAEHSNIPLSGR